MMNDAPHITQAEWKEWKRLLTQPTYRLQNGELPSAHLAACGDCRRQWRTLLQEEMPAAPLLFGELEESEPLQECLQDDEAARLVRGQLADWERESALFHLEDCRACRTLIAELETFANLLDTQPVPTGIATTTSVLTSPPRPSAWDKGMSWLRQLEAQVASALQPLRPAATSYGFASAEQDKTRQKLEFSDPAITGSYRAENEQRLLHLEHTTFPQGTLVLIEAEDEALQVTWRCFAVFRRGMRRAVIDLIADGRVDLRTLRVGCPALEMLPEEILASLEGEYAAQTTSDPASRAGWATWAAQIAAETTPTLLHAQALAILKSIEAN